MTLSPPTESELAIGTSLGKDAWLRLKKNKVAMFSLWFVVAIIFLCFVGRVVGPEGGDLNDLSAPKIEMNQSKPSDPRERSSS